MESELQTQKSNSEKAINELNDQIKALNGEKATLNEQLSNLKDTSSKEAGDLRTQIERLTATIADKDKLMSETIQKTNEGKAKKNQTIADLRKQVTDLTNQVSNLEKEKQTNKQSYEDDHDSELNNAVKDAEKLRNYAQKAADDADKKVNTNTLNQ